MTIITLLIEFTNSLNHFIFNYFSYLVLAFALIVWPLYAFGLVDNLDP